MDVRIEVTSPGGHSSVPPKHTSIGLLASALVYLEERPHEVHLTRTSPVYQTLLCAARHTPEIPVVLKKALLRSVKSDKALRLAEKISFGAEDGYITQALAGTTQAVDLIEGGVKVNALPERAAAVVNHRISTERQVFSL
jgi:Gly-Xaa carboxypeptidase